jgi:FAD/FMN-containing dehydrogenase
MASNLFNRIPPLFSDLAKILAGEIDCSIETLTRYSRDASSYHIPPQAVIYPKNSTDIKHVLGLAREYGIPVTTRGSGRSTSGGSIGEGIILDMSRYFTYIRGINFIENTISVDAGVPVGELLDRLNDMQVDIPYLHGLNRASSIGSVVATRPVSASSFLYGSIREWVEGMTVVVDNGEEHHIQDGITPSGRLLGIYQSVFPFITKESALIRAGKPKVHDDPTGYTLWSSSIGPRQLYYTTYRLRFKEGSSAVI